jgi:SOS response regulatory protein OraA/RecX
MDYLNIRVQKIHLLLLDVLKDLNSIDDSNFDEKIARSKQSMEKVNAIKSELKSKFTTKELRQFDGELTLVAKQIQKVFDNIVADKKQQISQVSAELEIVQNQKKLAIYLG